MRLEVLRTYLCIGEENSTPLLSPVSHYSLWSWAASLYNIVLHSQSVIWWIVEKLGQNSSLTEFLNLQSTKSYPVCPALSVLPWYLRSYPCIILSNIFTCKTGYIFSYHACQWRSAKKLSWWITCLLMSVLLLFGIHRAFYHGLCFLLLLFILNFNFIPQLWKFECL